ncbi:PAC2 family protein [Ruicaihuangia caeni]|uniref:PAC2 family protein n=1 Tax=Ruicaihuangia caeni TaxID=3042517 RepID=UPI00338F42D6
MSDSPDFTRGRLLVIAFEGWNDAGDAASGAVAELRDRFPLQPVYQVESEDYFDYQFNRPMLQRDDSGERVIVWPSVTLYGPFGAAGEFGADADTQREAAVVAGEEAPSAESAPTDFQGELFVLLGSEPSRGWKTFTNEILDAAIDHGITGIVMLGAMLADVPHTRPISIFATSENDETRRRLNLERSTYEGPTGILSVLADAAERAGIPSVMVWASVPHYVHNAPSPKATLALLDKLRDLFGVEVPRERLVNESLAWEAGIDALADDDDEMSAYIEQLEQARDTVESPLASGEAIAEEFERYLRRRGGPGGAAAAGTGGPATAPGGRMPGLPDAGSAPSSPNAPDDQSAESEGGSRDVAADDDSADDRGADDRSADGLSGDDDARGAERGDTGSDDADGGEPGTDDPSAGRD